MQALSPGLYILQYFDLSEYFIPEESGQLDTSDTFFRSPKKSAFGNPTA